MISKISSLVLASSIATSGTAFAQSSPVQLDKAQLSTQVSYEAGLLNQLNKDIIVLLERIHEKEIDVASDKKIRNISLAVAGLGILEVLLVKKYAGISSGGGRGIDLSGLGVLLYMTPGLVGIAGGTLTAAGSQLFILIGSNKLGQLKEELVKKQKEITDAQVKLNIYKETLN